MTLKAVLLDLGGVVYVGEKPLPGSIEAVRALRDSGLAVRFLTNTTRTPHRKLLGRLHAMGVPAEAGELFMPALAARRLIEEKGLSPRLLVHPNLKEDFADLPEGSPEALVVGDAGEGFTYAAMNEAFRVLDRGAEFLALADNRTFRDSDGELSLDAGPFVAALSYATRRQPVVLGKPSADFFRAALDDLSVAPEEAAMVGDDVEADVAGAMALGLTGVLVKTGKYEEGAESRIDSAPSKVVDDLAAAAHWLIGRNETA